MSPNPNPTTTPADPCFVETGKAESLWDCSCAECTQLRLIAAEDEGVHDE